MALLHLPLKREFFEQIRLGSKLEEYRLRNAYWRQRLEGRTFGGIVLTLGYPPAADMERRLSRPWRGYVVKSLQHDLFGPEPVEVYAIRVN